MSKFYKQKQLFKDPLNTILLTKPTSQQESAVR